MVYYKAKTELLENMTIMQKRFISLDVTSECDMNI